MPADAEFAGRLQRTRTSAETRESPRKLGGICWLATVSRPGICARVARLAAGANTRRACDSCRLKDSLNLKMATLYGSESRSRLRHSRHLFFWVSYHCVWGSDGRWDLSLGLDFCFSSFLRWLVAQLNSFVPLFYPQCSRSSFGRECYMEFFLYFRSQIRYNALPILELEDCDALFPHSPS